MENSQKLQDTKEKYAMKLNLYCAILMVITAIFLITDSVFFPANVRMCRVVLWTDPNFALTQIIFISILTTFVILVAYELGKKRKHHE